MSLLRLIAQRVILGLVAIWSLLTVVFGLFTMTPDWALSQRIAMAGFPHGLEPGEADRIREGYLAARGLDRPLSEIYLDWMGNMITLQWGESFRTREPVFPAVMAATRETATYLVPAIVLAMIIGLGIGFITAFYRDSLPARALRSGTYFGLGLPHFWVGFVILVYVGIPPAFNSLETVIMPSEMPFLYGTVLPILLVTLALSAAIVSYARAYSLQYLSSDITKLVRAKGGGRIAVSRHVLRNAAIPLVSLVFAETFALLALSVFVLEALFGINGIGLLIYNTVWARDLPVLLGASMVVISIGVLCNVLQDLAYSFLDPRVDTGTR